MNKSAFIAFRASDNEARMLDHVASSRGTSRSEVLRRGLAGETLSSLRRERAAILAKLVEVEATRAKLGSFDDEIEKCKNALQAFANKHSDAIDTWTGAGCVGHRPEPEFGKHAELETKLHHALFAADNARTAENSLDIREAAARKELAKITSRLRDAAIKQVQFQIVEQADAIAELQAKLAELQASQHGAYEFVKSCDEKLYADFEVRHPAFGFWRDGIEGLAHDPLYDLKAADPSRVREWRDRFDALVKGE